MGAIFRTRSLGIPVTESPLWPRTDHIAEPEAQPVVPPNSDVIPITPTTLLAGMPDQQMAFITPQTPGAWVQGGEAQSLLPIGAAWWGGDSGAISSLIAGVQPGLANDIAGGITNITPRHTGGGAAGPALPEPTPPGSPSSDLDVGKRADAMFKPHN
jgi:hypothetical protein